MPPPPCELRALLLGDELLLEAKPAAIAASATSAARMTAIRRCLLMSLLLLLPVGGSCGSSSLFDVWNALRSALGAHVERVAEAVAEQVERESRDDQERAREQHQPPGDVVELRGVVEDRAPRRLGRGDAEPEVRERGLEEDVRRDQQRAVHDQRADEVRQDLLPEDPEVGRAGGPGGLDELLLAQGERVAADDARDVGPGEDRDHRD